MLIPEPAGHGHDVVAGQREVLPGCWPAPTWAMFTTMRTAPSGADIALLRSRPYGSGSSRLSCGRRPSTLR
ncbi:hypothetical protein ACFQ0B_37485 [Nonomuraea thailandensis]